MSSFYADAHAIRIAGTRGEYRMTGGEIIFVIIFFYAVIGCCVGGVYLSDIDRDFDLTLSIGIGIIWPFIIILFGLIAVKKAIKYGIKIFKES
jgi:hypothetical protein